MNLAYCQAVSECSGVSIMSARAAGALVTTVDCGIYLLPDRYQLLCFHISLMEQVQANVKLSLRHLMQTNITKTACFTGHMQAC